ncbi:MAG: hypothetical protein IJR44_05110 [Neisseriaceae bacterium]|nr:hypothetical protein [Neisseriaceae bacterium]
MMKKLAISALVLGLLGVSNVASAACENIYVGKVVIYNGQNFFVLGFSSKSGKATIASSYHYQLFASDLFSTIYEVKCSSLKEVELGK